MTSCVILFAGTPQVAVTSLNYLHEAGFEIAAVLTRPDAPLGRKRVLTPSPVAARAEELGLPIIKAAKITDETTAQLAQLNLDAAGDGCCLRRTGSRSRAERANPRLNNLHFRCCQTGAVPHRWPALDHLQTAMDFTGAVTFQLETGLDTGPVFGQVTERIGELDTAGINCSTGSANPNHLAGPNPAGLGFRRQAGEPSRRQVRTPTRRKITNVDAELDFTRTATEIRRRAHGTTPFPGAWVKVDDKRFKFGPLRERREITDLDAGEVRIEPGGSSQRS